MKYVSIFMRVFLLGVLLGALASCGGGSYTSNSRWRVSD